METGTPTTAERLTLGRTARPAAAANFADEIRAGLRATPRAISPKWLYDELGSTLFEAICLLPEYDLTRTEAALLATRAGEIVEEFAMPLELVELGSGSAVKTSRVIEAILARQPSLRYHPIDISEEALLAASRRLVSHYPALEIRAHAGDYFSVLAERKRFVAGGRALVLFLGSNIGNYEPADARRLLRAVAGALAPGDALLLGADLKKSPAELEAAYDDPTGVTAAFVKNLLGRINRELGGEFDLRAFRHRVVWDAARGAVDSHLVATSPQRVRIGALGEAFDFGDGDAIHVESSYKFDRATLESLAGETGFALRRMWSDPASRFCEALLTVR